MWCGGGGGKGERVLCVCVCVCSLLLPGAAARDLWRNIVKGRALTSCPLGGGVQGDVQPMVGGAIVVSFVAVSRLCGVSMGRQREKKSRAVLSREEALVADGAKRQLRQC